jgi:hypothetical protein
MDQKDQVRILLQALNLLRSQHHALASLVEAIAHAEDEYLLRQWAQRSEREWWAQRLVEARN